MGYKFHYVGDCPNIGDFKLVLENMDRVIKLQEDYFINKDKIQNKLIAPHRLEGKIR